VNVEVLVAGAGPVGLTAALALASQGVDVAVADAADGVDPRMRASTFHPPTLDMLEKLGVADALIDAGLKVRYWQLRHHDTGDHVDFDMQLIAGDTRHPYRLQLPQQVLCEHLLDALDRLGVEVRFAARLTAAREYGDSVEAQFADGELGRCRWLIGADGAHSTVRESAGLDYGGRTYEHASVLVATPFPFHEYLDGLCDVSYCWSARGPFSLMRQPTLWRASLYPGVDDIETAADEDLVRAQLAQIVAEAGEAELLSISPYQVHERSAPRFRNGRLLLAGDAAHLNAPSGGMGMNGGIHDAFNLVDKLIRVLDGADDELLDRYSRQRHFVATRAVIPQAAANRRRMAANNRQEQEAHLNEHRAVAEDPARCREFLLRASMITGLEEAERVE